ncbi:MAG: insulinase family protein [Treponema sp.]|jgi:zinc protease|nr:insulinase family protein [Treponema sp.]
MNSSKRFKKCFSVSAALFLAAALAGLAGPAAGPLFAAGSSGSGAPPLFVLPSGALYGGLGEGGDSLPSRAALRRGVLPNGLSYYILENAVPAGRAYLTLAVNAGSILEEEDERGLAHFVEHMAFNGTRRFPGAEVVNYLRSLGMRFGPEVNAYTGYEETVYGIEAPVETGPGGIKRIPERALAILDDWTWTVAFNGADVEKERSIIMEEYRTRLGAQERIRQKLLPVIFRGSRYAERLPIGLPEVIQNAPAEKLRDFYRKWYRPDNMAVILVGDFDGAETERDLVRHFSAPAADGPLSRPRYELSEPRRGDLHTVIASDPELPYSTVYLYYKRAPRERERTLRDYREGLVDYLIETMTAFRYSELQIREDAPFLYASGWNDQYGASSRYYIMAAQAKAGRTADTLYTLLLEKERLCRYGFTRAELDRAKGAFLSNLEMAAAERDRQESGEFVQELTADFLYGRYALDREWDLEAARALLPAIGTGTVNAAAASYYAEDDVAVLLAAPETEAPSLPGGEAVAALVAKSRLAALEPPADESAALALGNEEPEPGLVVSVEQDQSGAEIWRLSNGMKLILMETANKNNELDIYALARGGTADPAAWAAGAADSGAAETGDMAEWRFSGDLAAEMASASGLGDLSRTELSRFLSDKQVSLAFWTNSHIRGFRGSAAVKDLPVLFQMLNAYFRNPRIDDTGFRLVQEQYRTTLSQEADNPETVFSKELSRLVYGNHPFFSPLEPEDLDKVRHERVNLFMRRALNPADYVLVLAGTLGNRGALRDLAETWLASLPARGPGASEIPRWNTWSDPGIKRPGKTEKIIRKGREEKAIVYMGWFVPRPWTEADNAAALVLNEYLDIVLTDEIREKLGGVYSVSAGVSLSPMPAGELSLGVYFICDPRREAELRGAVRELLGGLAAPAAPGSPGTPDLPGTPGARPLDEETLDRAREALVKTFDRSMENNGFVARNLGNFTVITGAPLSNLARRPDLYRGVALEQVRSLLEALLPGGPAELVLLPESADK